MLSEKAKAAVAREWRDLGFFYDLDENQKTWKIIGSVEGLEKFSEIIRKFSLDPRYAGLSENCNYGPYTYLELGTWHSPEISDHWIAGTSDQLRALAAEVKTAVSKMRRGDVVSLKERFSPDSEFGLEIELRGADFDPASEDPNLT